MRAGVFGVVALASVLGLAPLHGLAQAPPLPSPGFVSPYEILRTARAAGFDPVAPPLREGATYVLRAYDFRGILMRVVLDARSGAIRDANRIVGGIYDPDAEDEIGLIPPFGSPPHDLPSIYGAVPAYVAPETGPSVPPAHGVVRAAEPTAPPLPHLRPADFAVRNKAAHHAGRATKAKPETEADAPAAAAKAPANALPLND